jgi:predicted unusual protein kinase regulating ubiquinone biosynthesis (AarF/ABC1/UbiB family)
VSVKVGQFLSTRPDLVSAKIAEELRQLQQAMQPLPVAVIHAVLTDEQGAVPDTFASFARPVSRKIAQASRRS